MIKPHSLESRIVLAVTIAAGLLSGCTVGGTNIDNGIVKGSGNVVTVQREVSGIKEVVLTMSGRLTIEQTGQESLTLEGEDNILPLITTGVTEGRLTISLINNEGPVGFSNTKPLNYRLSVKDLSYLGNTGSGEVEVLDLQSDKVTTEASGSGNISIGKITTQDYAVVGTGSGNITASGTSIRQTVGLSGSGDYNGRSLETMGAIVEVSGSGSATVWASKSLSATVSGSGSIRYMGSPVVTKQVSVSGKVEPLR
ncbi:MAG: head GIN domain-containing protein [Chloroflexota bacterium]